MFLRKSPVGWPSPADDYSEDYINLNKRLINNPASTYLMRISGSSMMGVGINNGSVLIVDRSIKPKNNHIVIAIHDGSFICRKLRKHPVLELISADMAEMPIKIDYEDGVEIIGVVLAAINQY
jgi:DNA polymerase V